MVGISGGTAWWGFECGPGLASCAVNGRPSINRTAKEIADVFIFAPDRIQGMKPLICLLLLIIVIVAQNETVSFAMQESINPQQQKSSDPVKGGKDRVVMLNFDIKSLPKDLKYRGSIVMGAKWIDMTGENILILTQTGAFPSKGECITSDGCSDAEIYAYHFVRNGNSFSLLWRTMDYERNCSFDLYAGYLDKALYITDLDSDGVAESTFLYKLSCRSDVSPAVLKLIMHEGATKYAIRGTTKLSAGYGGGEMHIDPVLSASPVFKAFAIKTWNKYVTEDHFEQF
jgi:hypothetical protein